MSKTVSSKERGSGPRLAKLFRNGRNQAVRLPKEFEIQADEVIIRKQGDDLVLSPKPRSWEDYFSSAHRLYPDFPDDIEDLPLDSEERF